MKLDQLPNRPKLVERELRKEPVDHRLTRSDTEILTTLNQVQYMTASQLSRLFYSGKDADRYSQRRLKRLSDAGFVLRLRALPTPRFGSAPHVFTLSSRGQRYV